MEGEVILTSFQMLYCMILNNRALPYSAKRLFNRDQLCMRPMWCNHPRPQRTSQSRCLTVLSSFFSSVPLSQVTIIPSKLAPEHAVNLDLLSLQGLPCFLCSK